MPLKQDEIVLVKKWTSEMFTQEGEKYWRNDPGTSLEAYCAMVSQGLIPSKDFAIESRLCQYRYEEITPRLLHNCLVDIVSSCQISFEEYLAFANWSPTTLKSKLESN